MTLLKPTSTLHHHHHHHHHDQVILLWFVLDALTHLSIEFGYVVLALGPTAERSSGLMGKLLHSHAALPNREVDFTVFPSINTGFIWREYSRADKR